MDHQVKLTEEKKKKEVINIERGTRSERKDFQISTGGAGT